MVSKSYYFYGVKGLGFWYFPGFYRGFIFLYVYLKIIIRDLRVGFYILFLLVWHASISSLILFIISIYLLNL
jgi:hypothetical protein